MLKIIEFKESPTDYSAGFVKDNFVVYGQIGKSVTEGFTQQEIYQTLYQLVKEAIDYETQVATDGGTPSILVDPEIEGIEFVPEVPRAVHMKLHGVTFIEFLPGENEKQVQFTAEVKDQYEQTYTAEVIWTGTDATGLLVIPRPMEFPQEIEVSAQAEDAIKSLMVYVVEKAEPEIPESSEIEVVQKKVLELEQVVDTMLGETGGEERMPLTHEERMLRAIKFNEERRAGVFAGRIATRNKLILDELSSGEIAQLVSIYPAWADMIGKPLKDGTVPGETQDIISHHGTLYKVIQGHTAQADWSPDAAVSLFTSFTPVGTVPNWEQKQGAHDAYQVGDRVKHNDLIWVSTAKDNVWEPGVYGWVVDNG